MLVVRRAGPDPGEDPFQFRLGQFRRMLALLNLYQAAAGRVAGDHDCQDAIIIGSLEAACGRRGTDR